MIIKKVNIWREFTSCNFCSKGKLNGDENGLIYPYKEVYKIEREKSGILVFICEECLKELKLKTVEI